MYPVVKDMSKLITPCPVCHSVLICPHTPIRCDHDWQYGGPKDEAGTHRECGNCGRVERAKLSWETVVA